ncbi:MAG: GNAT family N-acetyltransferase [Actinobacteria bacterium]|nr:GNAT family N-acetyltransferase [Actinomycetota bacterium]
MIEIVAERVSLRSPTLEDVEALAALTEDDPASFASPGADGRERLRSQIERHPTLDDGGFLQLVVESDGRLIGDIQARAPEHGFPPGVCEIGITLAPDVRGRGLGLEAVGLFTTYLLEQGSERVQASTAVGNVAMRRVLERAGYTFEGVLRSYAPAGDGREDYAMYAVTRSY